MTKARNIADLLDANGDVKSGSLDNVPAVDLTNLSASNLTSGTIPDARVPASAVSQHAVSFDDNKIVNDISTLALRQATQENLVNYNTNSMFVDVFQDGTGIASNTNAPRNTSEYVATIGENAGSAVTFNNTGSDQTYTPSNVNRFEAYLWGAGGGAGWKRSPDVRHDKTGGAGGFASGSIAITGSPTYKIVVGSGGDANNVTNGYSGGQAYGGGGRGRVTSHDGVGGGGGGYSGIFLTSVAHGNSVIIAGGGAGANSEADSGKEDYAGNGGGNVGQDGGLNTSGSHLSNGNGKGGTQSAGGGAGASDTLTPTAGSALQGGDGSHMSGGAGGGYYGGGGGGHTSSNGTSGAGGGSGYIGHSSVSSGVNTGATHVNETGDRLPPETSNSYYSSGVGAGGNEQAGGAGKVVLIPYSIANNATGNFISNVITASSSTNKMGAIITYQDFVGTNALNTDIIIQLSADNGSNFTTATLVAMPDFSTGIKMARVNDLNIGTAGTQLKYKILFANQSSGSKEARIRGVSLQY